MRSRIGKPSESASIVSWSNNRSLGYVLSSLCRCLDALHPQFMGFGVWLGSRFYKGEKLENLRGRIDALPISNVLLVLLVLRVGKPLRSYVEDEN